MQLCHKPFEQHYRIRRPQDLWIATVIELSVGLLLILFVAGTSAAAPDPLLPPIIRAPAPTLITPTPPANSFVPTLSLPRSVISSSPIRSSPTPLTVGPTLLPVVQGASAVSPPVLTDEHDIGLLPQIEQFHKPQQRTIQNVNRLPSANATMFTKAITAEAAISGPMEIFLLPEPIHKRSLPGANGIFASPFARYSTVRPMPQSTLAGEVTYSAYAGYQPIDVTMNGDVDGQVVQSHLVPTQFLDGDLLNSNSVLVSSGGEGVSIGGTTSNVPDAGAGLRFFKPFDNEQGVAGVGLYQRLGATTLSPIPGIDAEITGGKDRSLDFAAAADSSLRVTQKTKIAGWSEDNFIGWSESNHELLNSIAAGRRFNSLSVFQSFGLTTGSERGYAWNQSYLKKVGDSSLSFDSSVEHFNDGSSQISTVSFLRPVGRNLLSAQWQNDSQSSFGTTGRESQFVSNLMMPSNNGSVIVVGNNLANASGDTLTDLSNISDNWTLGKAFSLQLGIVHNWTNGSDRLNGSLGVWATRQWEAKLLFGPSTTLFNQSPPTIFGFQLVNRFDLTSYQSGTISGTVLLDGIPASVPIRMLMDDQVTITNGNGRFKFGHALVGSHEVGFDVSQLPATISSDVLYQTVDVSKNKTENVIFSAYRVGKVEGRVTVAPDALGQIDPTADAGIVISDNQGHETTTNADGTYVLGTLPLGKHTVAIEPSSLPPGYTVLGASSEDEDIEAGVTCADVDFTIAVHQKVDMTTLLPPPPHVP